MSDTDERGVDLLALVLSWRLGVSHDAALRHARGLDEVHPSWGELADELWAARIDVSPLPSRLRLVPDEEPECTS